MTEAIHIGAVLTPAIPAKAALLLDNSELGEAFEALVSQPISPEERAPPIETQVGSEEAFELEFVDSPPRAAAVVDAMQELVPIEPLSPIIKDTLSLIAEPSAGKGPTDTSPLVAVQKTPYPIVDVQKAGLQSDHRQPAITQILQAPETLPDDMPGVQQIRTTPFMSVQPVGPPIASSLGNAQGGSIMGAQIETQALDVRSFETQSGRLMASETSQARHPAETVLTAIQARQPEVMPTQWQAQDVRSNGLHSKPTKSSTAPPDTPLLLEPIDTPPKGTEFSKLSAFENSAKSGKLPVTELGQVLGLGSDGPLQALTSTGVERSAGFVKSALIAPAQAEVAQNISAQLVGAVSHNRLGVTEVFLNPQELGRVTLSMASQENILTLTILADRPETFELLRRHIDQLAQDFRGIGFDDIQFNFEQQGQEDRDQKNLEEPIDQERVKEPDMTGVEAHLVTLRPGRLNLRL